MGDHRRRKQNLELFVVLDEVRGSRQVVGVDINHLRVCEVCNMIWSREQDQLVIEKEERNAALETPETCTVCTKALATHG